MKDFKDSTVAKGAMHSVYEAAAPAGCVGLNRLVAQNETLRFHQLKISKGREMALIE